MKRLWIVWLVTSIAFSLYAATGYFASRTEIVSMVLKSGQVAEVSVFRFLNQNLGLTLEFKGWHLNRPELGSYGTHSDWRKDGKLVFESPGAAVKLAASLPTGSPVIYEAMPMGARGSDSMSRGMTSDLSSSRGVWRWPPAGPKLTLAKGFNRVKFEVYEVEAPLIGETIEVWVQPPLGIKSADDRLGWLWPALFWPLVAPVFLFIGAVLGGITYWRYTHER